MTDYTRRPLYRHTTVTPSFWRGSRLPSQLSVDSIILTEDSIAVETETEIELFIE